MKKFLVMALALALPVAAIAQQSAAPKPTVAPKVETKKTESVETKSDTVVKQDGVKKSTRKHHKKTTKKSSTTAPEAVPTPKM